MNVEQAQRLRIGAQVHCPEDRGEPAYFGVVRGIGPQVHKNIHGVEYVWILVSKSGYYGGTSRHVWPSNRLS